METIDQHFGVNAFSAPNLQNTKSAGSSQVDGNISSSTPNTHWYF